MAKCKSSPPIPLWARRVMADALFVLNRSSVTSKRYRKKSILTRRVTSSTTRTIRSFPEPVAVPLVVKVQPLLPPPIPDFFVSPQALKTSKERTALSAAIERGGALVVFVGLILWCRAGGPITTLEACFQEAKSWNWDEGSKGIFFEMSALDLLKRLNPDRLLGKIFHGAVNLLKDGHGVWDADAQHVDCQWLRAWRQIEIFAPLKFARVIARQSLVHGEMNAQGHYAPHPCCRISSAEYCCGIGLGGRGLSRNRVHRLLAVDFNRALSSTYNSSREHGDAEMTVSCVNEVEKLLAALKLRMPDILLMTSDCSPHSPLGLRLDEKDSRSVLHLQAMKKWFDVGFQCIIFENAKNYTNSTTHGLVHAMLAERGYISMNQSPTLCASRFGSAFQRRERDYPVYIFAAISMVLERFVFPQGGNRNKGARAALTPFAKVAEECFIKSTTVTQQLEKELPRLTGTDVFSGWYSYRYDVGMKGESFAASDSMATVVRNRSSQPVCRVRSHASSPIQLFRHPTPQEIGKSLDLRDGEISLAHANANTMSSWLGNGLSPTVVESLVGAVGVVIKPSRSY